MHNAPAFNEKLLKIEQAQTNLKIPPVFDDPKVFSKGNVVSDEASVLRSQSNFKWQYGLGWFKGIDDLQVFEWQKVISDGSHDFDNPKAYGDTSILDGPGFIIIKYDGCLEDIDFMDFGTLQLIEKIFWW